MQTPLSKYNGACTYLIVAPTLTPYTGQAQKFRNRMVRHKSDGKLARINHEKWLADKNKPKVCAISHAIHKYGWENMCISILEKYPEWDQQLLDEHEKHFIRFYDSFKHGYNCTEGGGGNSGHTHTEEAKAKMSAAAIGRTHTTETKAKIGALKSKPVTSCEILDEYANGDQLVEFVLYASARDAHKKTKVSFRNISDCCNKKQKSAGGLYWHFTKEGDEEGTICVSRIGDKPKKGKSTHKRALFSVSPEGVKQLHEGSRAAEHTLSNLTGKKFNNSAISACCNGKLKTYKGYTFYFASDKEIEEFEKEQKAAASKKRKREITDYFKKSE